MLGYTKIEQTSNVALWIKEELVKQKWAINIDLASSRQEYRIRIVAVIPIYQPRGLIGSPEAVLSTQKDRKYSKFIRENSRPSKYTIGGFTTNRTSCQEHNKESVVCASVLHIIVIVLPRNASHQLFLLVKLEISKKLEWCLFNQLAIHFGIICRIFRYRQLIWVFGLINILEGNGLLFLVIMLLG